MTLLIRIIPPDGDGSWRHGDLDRESGLFAAVPNGIGRGFHSQACVRQIRPTKKIQAADRPKAEILAVPPWKFIERGQKIVHVGSFCRVRSGPVAGQCCLGGSMLTEI